MMLLVLVSGLYVFGQVDGFWDGTFLGLGTRTWVVLAAGNAIVHQVFVWFCWRTELHGGLLTHLFGRAAFPLYAVVFAILILARPVLITGVAIANAGALPIGPSLAIILAVLAAIPSAYTLYSIRRYFGIIRAFGIDHFDASYRSMPLVREGIFRYTSNAMYIFGLLALYIPGLAMRSIAALAVALFSHLYIWAHYFFTEKPDMEVIYGADESEESVESRHDS